MSETGSVNNPPISGQGVSGQAGLHAGNADFSQHLFLINQVLGQKRTVTLVQVQKCTNKDDVAAVGTVDVVPLVNMIDGLGTAYEHGTVFGISYFRLQGGANAVIIDPKVGDIGIAVISDRDISTVRATKKKGPPGSRRRFDLADAIFIGGVLGGVPTQYVRFLTDPDSGEGKGIEAVDALGNSIKTSDTGMAWADKNSNTIISDTDGVKINGVLFDRDQNVAAIADLTTTGMASLGGGSQAVKLADNSAATKVKAT